MSKYHDELQRKLANDPGMAEIAEWFFHCVAADPKIQKADLTKLERQFWKHIVKGFFRFRGRRNNQDIGRGDQWTM